MSAPTIQFSGLSLPVKDFNELIKKDTPLSDADLNFFIKAVKMDEKLTQLLSMFSKTENTVSLKFADGTEIAVGTVEKDKLKVATVDSTGGTNSTGFTFTYDGKPVTKITYDDTSAAATGAAGAAAPAAGTGATATGAHGGSRRRRRRRRKNKSYKKHSS